MILDLKCLDCNSDVDYNELMEEIELETKIAKKIWTTRDGRDIEIKDMETSHIQNCIEFINREINGKRWCYAEEYTKLFNEELKARGVII